MTDTVLVGVDRGDMVRATAAFTNAAGAAADPTAVSVQVQAPGGIVTTYVYGDDLEVVKDSTGNYHIDLAMTAAYRWRVRWFGTGTVEAAVTGLIDVAPDAF